MWVTNDLCFGSRRIRLSRRGQLKSTEKAGGKAQSRRGEQQGEEEMVSPFLGQGLSRKTGNVVLEIGRLNGYWGGGVPPPGMADSVESALKGSCCHPRAGRSQGGEDSPSPGPGHSMGTVTAADRRGRS